MNCRTLLVLCVVLLAASTVFAIQTGKLRVKDKVSPDTAVLDAGLPADQADASPLNIVDETVVEQMESAKTEKTQKTQKTANAPKRAKVAATNNPSSPSAPHKAHTGKKGSERTASATKKVRSAVEPKSTRTAAKTSTSTSAKTKKTPIYLRTDGLPEYAAKAKELLAAAEEQSWPGEPLVQGCTPLECQQWCAECGTTATCENRCFLYSQCNDDC